MPRLRKEFLPFGRPSIGKREIAAVTRVLQSRWIGMGPEVIAFEKELAEAIGVPHVLAVNSCTSALFLSLLVLGISRGDEVVVPSLTWCSSANAALYLGAKPVFCDVDAETLNATPATILARVTPRTRAVVVVHLGGRTVDVAALRKALPARVAIVEDAAHALGAAYPDGRPVGSSGNLVCFSFYANKNLTTGEGGAIALADAAMADRIRSLRLHGLPLDAWNRFSSPRSLLLSPSLDELGYKMNLTDLQAALGRVQLARQAEFAKVRLAVAKTYMAALRGLRVPAGLQKGVADPDHSRHLFVVRLPIEKMRLGRDELILELRARNIGASIHYAPLHRMPLYRSKGLRLPVTEDLAKRIVTLPISASMTAADARYVAAQLRELLA